MCEKFFITLRFFLKRFFEGFKYLAGLKKSILKLSLGNEFVALFC